MCCLGVQWGAVLAPEIDEAALETFKQSEEARQQAEATGGAGYEELTLLEVPLVLTAQQEEQEEEETAEGEGAGQRPRTGLGVLDGLDLQPLTGGGLLVREPLPAGEQALWSVVSDERPTAEELRDLVFGWRLLPHLPHAAIVLCAERQVPPCPPVVADLALNLTSRWLPSDDFAGVHLGGPGPRR